LSWREREGESEVETNLVLNRNSAVGLLSNGLSDSEDGEFGSLDTLGGSSDATRAKEDARKKSGQDEGEERRTRGRQVKLT